VVCERLTPGIREVQQKLTILLDIQSSRLLNCTTFAAGMDKEKHYDTRIHVLRSPGPDPTFWSTAARIYGCPDTWHRPSDQVGWAGPQKSTYKCFQLSGGPKLAPWVACSTEC